MMRGHFLTCAHSMAFDSLGLSAPILQAIEDKGYTEPSPIQAQAVPAVLTGKDVMAAAQTGTGKTAGFTLPLLEMLQHSPKARSNNVKALILTPTRELAAQISESIDSYGKYTDIRSTVVFGGVKINPQMMRLRRGVEILVATPGRLLDLYQQKAVKFSDLEILVLDEADRMLDMGFIHDIRKIKQLLPKQRQNLMFSATFSPEIRELAKGLINNPLEVDVAPRNTTAEKVEQSIIPVDAAKKSQLLIKLVKERRWFQVLVFSRTKHGANRIVTQLEKAGISAAAIHGNKSQGARTRALKEFKENKVNVLVATDIAARGIDIAQLPQVVNFDLPHVSEDYVHRIGRTARANSEGLAVSLVCADEFKQLQAIERLIQEEIPRETVDGFEPKNPLQASKLNTKPIKAKKPKKPKKAQDDTRERRPSAKVKPNTNKAKPQKRGSKLDAIAVAVDDSAPMRNSYKRPSQASNTERAKPVSSGSPWANSKIKKQS